MEYIAAALEARGHRVTLADLRFSARLAAQLRRARPALVGIAAMHALETDEVLALAGRRARAVAARADRRRRPHRRRVSGAVPRRRDVTAVVLDDGERALPDGVRRARARPPLTDVPGLALRGSRRRDS